MIEKAGYHIKRNNIKVSVIVTVYNAEKYLDQSIKSILKQTYSYIEIILVNDGSTDDSLNICNKYQQMDARISVISQPNQGLICARKTGLLHAKGLLVGFVDSDDWIEPEMYEEMVSIYEKYQPELISTGIYRDYEKTGNHTEACDHYAEGFYNNLSIDIYPTMLRNPEVKDFGLYCTLVNKLYIKDKLLKVYEEINPEVFYGEDCLTLYQYCLRINSIYIRKKSFYHYNIRDGSMCWRPDERLPYNTYLLYQELKKAFMNYSEPYILMKQLRRYILDVEIHNLQMLYDIDINVFGKWKFQYENYYDSQIVIYGAGQCGQALYHQMCLYEKSGSIVAWVDENYNRKTEQCLYKIESPEILLNLKYDFIIIAVIHEGLAREIKNNLIELYSVKKKHVVWKRVWHEALIDG